MVKELRDQAYGCATYDVMHANDLGRRSDLHILQRPFICKQKKGLSDHSSEGCGLRCRALQLSTPSLALPFQSYLQNTLQSHLHSYVNANF